MQEIINKYRSNWIEEYSNNKLMEVIIKQIVEIDNKVQDMLDSTNTKDYNPELHADLFVIRNNLFKQLGELYYESTRYFKIIKK